MPHGCADIVDGLYILDIDESFYSSSYVNSHNDLISHKITWQARLGHIGYDKMVRLG